MPLLLSLVLAVAQDDLAREIAGLAADGVEQRDAAAKRLKARGVDILPALRTWLQHPDPEVVARVRTLVRSLEIRSTLSPRLILLYPSLDDRLAAGPPTEWPRTFLEIAKDHGGPDLDPLAAEAVRHAAPGQRDEVFDAVARFRLRAAFPALVDTVHRERKMPARLADALAAIGDPAAVPLLLDFPPRPDGCVAMLPETWLLRFGAAAHPEFERRIQAWATELPKQGGVSLHSAISALRQAGSRETDLAKLELAGHLLAVKGHESDYLLSTLTGLLLPRYPEEAVDILWKTVDDPKRLPRLLTGLQLSSTADQRAAVTKLWERARARKDVAPASREALLSVLTRLSPELLTSEKPPVADAAEALAVLACFRHDTDPAEYRKGIDRVEAFLAAKPSPAVALRLAEHYYWRKNDRRAELRYAQAGPLAPLSSYYLAEVKLRLGKTAEAEALFRDVLPAAKEVGLEPAAVQARLAFAASLPHDPRVRWRAGPSPRTKTHSYMEAAGGRLFFLGEGDAVCVADPFAGEVAVIAPRPGKVRDFMPLDGRRVFVALDDGTADLYEVGSAAPLWSRPLSLGEHSALTASPRCITAATEDGGFHAIDPATGKTLWTRRVEGRAWRTPFWRSERGPTTQAVDRVLVPGGRERLELVDLASGETRGELRPDFPVARVVEAADVLLLAGRDGRIAGFAARDGTSLWRISLPDQVRNSDIEIDLAAAADGTQVFLALHERLLALDPRTGRTRWEWRWTPRPGGETERRQDGRPWPRVLPTSDGVFCVVNWMSSAVDYNDRSDVIFLTPEGKPDFQFTSPRESRYHSGSASWPSAVGGNLAVYRNGWEIWERR